MFFMHIIYVKGGGSVSYTHLLPKSAKGVAFAVHVQAVCTSDGERILPALMNDNYFTLMPGETKNLMNTYRLSLFASRISHLLY